MAAPPLDAAIARLAERMQVGPRPCPERAERIADGRSRCPACGAVWDRDEARPPCPGDAPSAGRAAAAAIDP